jgi:hypothetical protein
MIFNYAYVQNIFTLSFISMLLVGCGAHYVKTTDGSYGGNDLWFIHYEYTDCCYWTPQISGDRVVGGSYEQATHGVAKYYPHEGREMPFILSPVAMVMGVVESIGALAMSPLCMSFRTVSRGNAHYTWKDDMVGCFVYAEDGAKKALVMSPPAQLWYVGENVAAKFK